MERSNPVRSRCSKQRLSRPSSLAGRVILAKVMQEARLASQQLLQCRNYLELLFSPVACQADRTSKIPTNCTLVL
jgi:hypothetical protein